MTKKFALLDEIGYSQLRDSIRRYKSEPSFQKPEGNPLYLETIKKRNVWDNLDKISLDDVEKVVLRFLNKWKCRLSYDCASKLRAALQKTNNRFQLLKHRKTEIQTVDFGEIVGTSGKSVNKIIKEIFEILSTVKADKKPIGFTATTKIMHMVIPTLFVMCEREIREGYGCAGNSEGYLNFLYRMQKASQRLIEEKPKVEICEELYCGDRDFTKILDEYNYYTMKFLPKASVMKCTRSRKNDKCII